VKASGGQGAVVTGTSGKTVGPGRGDSGRLVRSPDRVTHTNLPPDLREASADELVLRMGERDRYAAAEFLRRYEGRIRRRVRTALNPAIRRLYDSMDIVSTMSRRLDAYVAAGKFESLGVEPAWGLLCRLAEHAVVDKARIVRRAERLEGPDGEFARRMLERLDRADDAPEIEIDATIESLPDETDRRILTLWLHGMDQRQISDQIGLGHDAVRKRWERIRRRLSDRMEHAA
jgi:DNA-directed RNA polymerase specialized sigma24 family protein